MKVALVHYWLVGMRGGEKVLEVLCELFPDADIYTLVADKSKLSETILKHKIYTSNLQKFGGIKHYKKMLPLMPNALEAFDLTSYDLIISSEAGPAKGIIPGPESLHICYCHSPMRYIWDLYHEYYQSAGKLARLVMALTSPWLRSWDVTTASRVDYFIANSKYVASRINKFYRRDAVVINPPVETSRFSSADSIGDFYLCAGQITPYKRIDIAIEACNKLNKKLVIVGSGAGKDLKELAGPTVKFADSVDDDEMAHLFRACKALIYPGIEDFGIVPLEVMASGRPVIAFNKGGATETVKDGVTGILFKEQNADSLSDAIIEFEKNPDLFSVESLQAHAQSFDRNHFKTKLNEYITSCIQRKEVEG